MPPIVLFVGLSDTGKTTLVELVIRCLKKRGYTVAALKHSRHEVRIDTEGTDSRRFSDAGADISLLSSPGNLSFTRRTEREMDPEEITLLYGKNTDIMLVEGYKYSPFPKIEVHRSQAGKELLCIGRKKDPNLIAVVSDVDLDIDVPVFDLDDFEGLCDFIVDRYLK